MFGKSHYEKAQKAYDAHEHYKAILAYFKAIDSGDLNRDEMYFSLVGIAKCYIAEDEYDKAKGYLDRALKWNNEHYRVYLEYGRVYYFQRDYESALKYCEEALKRESKDFITWFQYGEVCLRLNRAEDVIYAFETALNLDTNIDSGLSHYLRSIVGQQKIRIAKEKGEKYITEKNFSSALEMFDQALDLDFEIIDDEDLADVHWMKGNCLLALKHPDEALKSFNKASSLSSVTELKVLLDLGNYYLNNRNLEKAATYFSEGIRKSNGKDSEIRNEYYSIFSTWYLWTQVQMSYLKKDFQSALNLIESLNPINTEMNSEKIVMKGKILYALERYEESITCLRRGIDEYGIAAYSHIGCSYQKMGHYETALRYLDEGLQKGAREEATVWVSKGECHLHLKHYEKALEAYRKALNYLNDSDEYTISEIEVKINTAKNVLARIEADKEVNKRPTHITIQGNNAAPINIGGILATEDAIINRATIPKDEREEDILIAFCPQCGCKVSAGDRFCRKCGGKLV